MDYEKCETDRDSDFLPFYTRCYRAVSDDEVLPLLLAPLGSAGIVSHAAGLLGRLVGEFDLPTGCITILNGVDRLLILIHVCQYNHLLVILWIGNRKNFRWMGRTPLSTHPPV